MKKRCVILIIFLLLISITNVNAAEKLVNSSEELETCLTNDFETTCKLAKNIEESSVKTIRVETSKDCDAIGGCYDSEGNPTDSDSLSRKVTLDLNGFNIKNIVFVMQSSKITIMDSKKTGTISADAEKILEIYHCDIDIKNVNIEGKNDLLYLDRAKGSITSSKFIASDNNNCTNNNFIIHIVNRAELTFKDVTSKLDNGCTGNAIIMRNTFEDNLTNVEIVGGEYYSKNGNAADFSGGNVVINGGKFKSDTTSAILSDSKFVSSLPANITINDAEIYGKTVGVELTNKSQLTVNGGTITGGKIGLYLWKDASNPTAKITGGTFKRENNKEKLSMYVTEEYLSPILIQSSKSDGYLLVKDILQLDEKTLSLLKIVNEEKERTTTNSSYKYSISYIDSDSISISTSNEESKTPQNENSTESTDVKYDDKGNQVVKVEDTLTRQSIFYECIGIILAFAGSITLLVYGRVEKKRS